VGQSRDRGQIAPGFRADLTLAAVRDWRELAYWYGSNLVSGVWVTGRPPMSTVGLLIYIMVDSVADTIDKVVAGGGEITQPMGADAPEITARFRDPAGNIMGLYQNP